MGVTQARVSRIENGELERSEVETLAAYVRALGSRLKIVAEFGDEQYTLRRPGARPRQRPRPRIGGSIRGRGRA